MVRTEDASFVRWREAGDAEALAEVYDSTAPALLRLALHHVRHPAAAEDLVQATFLAAIQAAASYDAQRPLLGWLVGILLNQAKWLQRREGRAVDATRLPDRAVADPLQAAQSAEFTAQCDEAIETLPEVYRPVLRLHLKHELNAAEIAHALGRAPGTVRSQVVRGLELLRAALPAGITLAALLVVSSGRGLAAVRETVLDAGAVQWAKVAATASSATTPLGLSLLGGLTMKKGACVLAAGLLLAASAWLCWPGEPQVEARGAAAPAATVAAMVPRDVQASTPSSPAPTLREEASAVVRWRLGGRVTDAGGRAVANASVAVGLQFEGDVEPLAETRTGPDGGYAIALDELRSLPPIDLARVEPQVAVVVTGHRRASGKVVLPHREAQRSLDAVHDVRLQAGAVVSGRVVDRDGMPVAAASVWLQAEGQPTPQLASTETAPDGTFRLDTDGDGVAVVVARRCDLGWARQRGIRIVGQDVAVADLQLQASSTLQARVVFEDGQPVPDVAVGVYEPGQDSQTVAIGCTDAEGNLVVRTLQPGRYRLRVDCHTDDDLAAPIVATDEAPANLVLTGVHLLRFRFVDEAGSRLRPMTIVYRTWRRVQESLAASVAAGAEMTAQPTGTSGAGSPDAMLIGRGIWLQVRAEHGEALAETMLQAMPPHNVIDVPLTIRQRMRSATLQLRLTSADALGLGECSVRLHQVRFGEPGSYELASAKVGEALLVHWTPGRYRLEVKPKEGMPDFGWFAPFERMVELRAGDTTTVEQVVQTGGRVRLHLHVPGGVADGKEVEALAVDTPAVGGPPWLRQQFILVREAGWEVGRALTETPLLWAPVLPAGVHPLTIRSRDYADAPVTAPVTARAVTDVHVTLQPR